MYFSTAPRITSYLLAALISVFALVGLPGVSPDVAHAEPAAARGKGKNQEQIQTGEYLNQLLGEINARRASLGAQSLSFATPGANQAVDQYLADLTPVMMAYGACFHGMYNPVAPGWDYVTASGLHGDALGEVLACPDDSGYWTPPHIADGWWRSPAHFEAIYADPAANVVACGTYGPQDGGQAYVTIACVTFRV
ncbi:MAG: CAP domain-containing protein [Chloroflexota bacterium]